ncbi:MAG TPA: cytochrome c oxidase subunit 3 [Bryobacteraceae bacterium]|nr:cytochrome c oxidase subunit 3 [Bryobacteraceae bacterium]
MKTRAPLGMLLFLLNEAVFFFMLIGAFVYFRGSALATAARSLNLAGASIYTVCLLASSITMWRGVAAGSRGWLGATLALGAIFLYGQGREYWALFRQNVTIGGDQFGTTFFTLTGIHALHVLTGLLLLLVLLSGAGRRSALDSIALYWYFVDAVWIVIFAVVYLWTFV